MSELRTNRLANASSPYLLQHKNNPVDWWEWSDEAFAEAKRLKKPVFLSIGYSTCHWCHVMEHESFEDEEIAKMMNDSFINIKLDREERPDIDHIYMNVCQMITGSGGWPLTIIMTPDKKPFFAGTYFPKDAVAGKIGMRQLIERTNEIWSNERAEVYESAEEITKVISEEQAPTQPGSEIGITVFRRAFHELASRFDDGHAGFGTKPKFPVPHNIMFLLRYALINDSTEAQSYAEETLKAMRRGGIFDHIGYGFHRYSTDAYWLVPHFEKMMYDQALLAIAYTEAWQYSGKDEFKRTAEEIFEYVSRDMTSPDGAFYSAEDADSEGEEGKFYLWAMDEIRTTAIGDVEFFVDVFNPANDGNYIDEIFGRKTGKNILHMQSSLNQVAAKHGLSNEDALAKINSLRLKFLNKRSKRVRPGLDDKILTDWNSLMIAAYAKSGAAFGNKNLVNKAIKAFDFILEKLRREDGRLFHRIRKSEAGIEGMVDDYAYFLWAALELYHATFDMKYLTIANETADVMINHFWDPEDFGFFFTANDAEKLIARRKEIYDGAIPSGNSVALGLFAKLGRMISEPRYLDIASKIVRKYSKQIAQYAGAYAFFMCGLYELLGEPSELVIVESENSMLSSSDLQLLRSKFIPLMSIIKIKDGDESLPDHLEEFKQINDKPTFYFCRNFSCNSPVTNISDVLGELSRIE